MGAGLRLTTVLTMALVAPSAVSLKAQDAAAAAGDDRVVEAVTAAVRRKVGGQAEVVVDCPRTRATLEGVRGIIAILPPDARFATPVRVALKGLRGRGRGVRVGEAECVIQVRAAHYRVASPVARNAEIAESSVQLVEGLLPPVRLAAPATDVPNGRALRDLAPGDILFARDLAVAPAVRSGDAIVIQLTSGRVRVTLAAVAAQDGHRGEEIRIVNPSSGKILRARVVGPRTVEVSHGT